MAETGDYTGEGVSLSALTILWKPDKCHSGWCCSLIPKWSNCPSLLKLFLTDFAHREDTTGGP